MSKKYTIIILVLFILVVVGGGYYWKTTMQKSAPEQTVENIQKTTTSGTNDVSSDALPATDTGAVNPTENAQGANPYDKTNPFTVKVNPFE